MIVQNLIKVIYRPLRKLLRKILCPICKILIDIYMDVYMNDKYRSELSYWDSRLKIDLGKFKNSHFRRLMLGMAEEPDDTFLKGKVVADFGCGPRGSLVWAHSANLRIGIDVLADRFSDKYATNIISHGMLYLKSTEKVIPLPSNFIDVMFTLNAIDHVDDFPTMCDEIIRVLKPGGDFIGSFNLEEPATKCEPQTLNERIIKKHLLNHLHIKSYRITAQGPIENQYGAFFSGNLSYKKGQRGYLWVRANKPKPVVTESLNTKPLL